MKRILTNTDLLRLTLELSHVYNVHLRYDVMTMTLFCYGFPLQNPQPLSTHVKNIRQIPTEDHSTKYLMSFLENCQAQHKTRKVFIMVTAERILGRHDY